MYEIELNKEESKEEFMTLPDLRTDCEIKIYLNGYLIKTAYSRGIEAAEFKDSIAKDYQGKVNETEIFIKITCGKIIREIEAKGFLRELTISKD